MDVTSTSLDFASNTFDVVQARCILWFMKPHQWESLVAECQRILSSGRVLALIEAEGSTTTSPATEEISMLLARPMARTGRSFLPRHPEGTSPYPEVTPFLKRFLCEAGFGVVRAHAYVLDYSVNTPAHQIWYQNAEMAQRSLIPFLAEEGKVHREHVEALCEQSLVEMSAPDFYAFHQFFAVCGSKPASGVTHSHPQQGRTHEHA